MKQQRLVSVPVTVNGGSTETVELPLLRCVSEAGEPVWPRIEVGADTMRVGKTTAVTVLAERLAQRGWPVAVGEEEWQKNAYLKDAYDANDPEQLSKFLLKSQRWFAKRKYEQVKREFTEALYIQDVHPEMDYVYALTNRLLDRMSQEDFLEYREFYLFLEWEALKLPDLLVYITASDKEMVARAMRGLRDFETAKEEYFLVMKQLNRKWLEEVEGKTQVLVVETDDFNFAEDEVAQHELADMVEEQLVSMGWQV